MENNILSIKKVTKFYKINKSNDFKALANVSLSFNKGELVSVIGESGSGKSTLMNLIGGLDSDYRGDIIIEGKSIKKYNESELDKYRKNKVGFIFQSFNLIPHLTILDNVTIAMTLSNVSKKERVKRATEILTELGMLDQINKKPNQLSGGQKQRVAIARALINDPDIILADEPTGALDSKTSQQILDIIRKISDKGKLIIMVTHSNKVASVSDRVIKIADGKIIEDIKSNDDNRLKEDHITINKDKQNLSYLSAIKISLRNMKEKLGRNILVSLGASIGIMSVIMMLSISNGVENYIVDQMNNNVNPLVVEVTKRAETESSTSVPDPSQILATTPFTEEDRQVLGEIENVISIDEGFGAMGIGSTVTHGDSVYSFTFLMATSVNTVEGNVIEGTLPNEKEIMLDAMGLKTLNGNYEDIIGSTVTVKISLNNEQIEKDLTVSGVYTQAAGVGIAYMDYEYLSALAASYEIDIEPTTLYLVTDDIDNTDAIKDAAVELGYTGSMAEAMLQTFTGMLDVITYILTAVAGISLFVSAIMILVVLYISVVERTSEIGVLKAIGARRKDIKRIFSTEALLIGFFGGIAGVLTSSLLIVIINIFTNQMFDMSLLAFVPEYMFFGIIISVLISLVSGLMPASKAAKLDPIESLRHE